LGETIRREFKRNIRESNLRGKRDGLRTRKKKCRGGGEE